MAGVAGKPASVVRTGQVGGVVAGVWSLDFTMTSWVPAKEGSSFLSPLHSILQAGDESCLSNISYIIAPVHPVHAFPSGLVESGLVLRCWAVLGSAHGWPPPRCHRDSPRPHRGHAFRT
jgi:hypothetical protein